MKAYAVGIAKYRLGTAGMQLYTRFRPEWEVTDDGIVTEAEQVTIASTARV